MQQQNNLGRVGLLLIAIFLFASCDNTETKDNKNTSLVEKELNDTTAQPVNEPEKLHSNNQTVENLDTLKRFNGKYPQEVKLLDNLVLSRRLQNLLKERYGFLKETWAVEPPIEINNNIFVASGCQQHNCDNINFIIVVDFSKDILYAGVRENQVVKTYSEDGSSSNEEITKWVNDKNN